MPKIQESSKTLSEEKEDILALIMPCLNEKNIIMICIENDAQFKQCTLDSFSKAISCI